MIDKLPQYIGEQEVWKSFSDNLPQHWVVYNTRSVNGREFDFCVMAPDLGLFIVEVKGWFPDGILTVVDQNTIILAGEEEPKGSPRGQARGYRFDLLNKIKRELGMNPLVMSLVCYPRISQTEYFEKGLNIVSETNETIFSDDLSDSNKLFQKFTTRYDVDKGAKHDDLSQKSFAILRHYFEPNFDLKDEEEILNPGYSRLRVIKEAISEETSKDIVDEYCKGIKEIVFVNSNDSLSTLVQEIGKSFSSLNIYPEHNNLLVGNNQIQDVTGKTTYSIFNFSIFVVQDLSCITENILIEDGECSDSQRESLVLLSDCTEFNFQQFEIEHAPCDHNILITAGAGTGKTYSMVSRIAYLCNKKVDSMVDIVNDLAMITFTNDAADNMKKRVKQMFTNYFVLTSNEKYLNLIEKMNQVQISTIHKMAFSLLQQDCLRMGLGYDSQISNENYQRRLLYHNYLNDYLAIKCEDNPDFLQQLFLPTYEIEDLLIEFSTKLYDKSFDIKDMSEDIIGDSPDAFPYFNEMLFEVAKKAEIDYSEYLTENNLLGLKQCMIQLHELVTSGMLQKHSHKYKYVFVDEFQDTDDIQIETITDLQKFFGNQCHLFIVGDLKQSIYRFRGASLSAFDKISNTSGIGNWRYYSLNRNYRSDSELLDSFHEVFQGVGEKGLLPYDEIKDRLNSHLTKRIGDGDKLLKVETHSRDSEAFYEDLFSNIRTQAVSIRKEMESTTLSKEERTIAILVRYNYQISNIIKKAEASPNIGFSIRTTDGGDLYRLDSTHDLYKLVMAVVNPYNKVYLANLIKSNYVSLHINLSQLSGCSSEAKTEELIKILDEYFELHTGKNWRQIVTDFSSRPVLVVLREIYDSTKPWIHYKNESKQLSYRENYNLIIERLTRKFTNDYITVNKICDSLRINITTYQEESSRNDIEEDDIDIICTTIHKSKGLEYGTVILPFTNENIANINVGSLTVNIINGKITYSLSVGNSSDWSHGFDEQTEITEKMSEEMRILYVAMTRAIGKFIWFKDLDNEQHESWGNYLGGEI